MKNATCWLIVEKHGSNVPKTDITPAEAQVLVHIHHRFIGKCPVTDVKEGKDIERTDVQEVNRLKSKYGSKVVEELYGKVNHRLPKSFDEALVVPGADEPDTGDAKEAPTPAMKPVSEPKK